MCTSAILAPHSHAFYFGYKNACLGRTAVPRLRLRILSVSGIQIISSNLEAVTVHLVGNNPNMMYLRETCSQPDCPSKAAGANHDAAAERRLHFILLCEFKKRVRSRSVHEHKTCKQNATVTAYWRLPTNFKASKHVFLASGTHTNAHTQTGTHTHT